MLTTCTIDHRGTFRASTREFVIVDHTNITVDSITRSLSKIRYRYERTTVEIADAELRELADDGWADEAGK